MDRSKIVEPIKNCINCNSNNLQQIGKVGTLVGFFGEDLNHYWTTFKCKDCSHQFEVQNKGKNYWVKDSSGRVLLGIPNCCTGEKYEVIQQQDSNNITNIIFENHSVVGIGVGNIKAIEKLELYKNEDDNLEPII